jgi:hypothetical protein
MNELFREIGNGLKVFPNQYPKNSFQFLDKRISEWIFSERIGKEICGVFSTILDKFNECFDKFVGIEPFIASFREIESGDQTQTF